MNSWLLICNTKHFNIDKAFYRWMMISWPQSVGAMPGDDVFIYVGDSCDAIKYICKVVETDLSTMDDNSIEFVQNLAFYDDCDSYMRLRLIAVFSDGGLSANQLITAGIDYFGSSYRLSDAQAAAIRELAEKRRVIFANNPAPNQTHSAGGASMGKRTSGGSDGTGHTAVSDAGGAENKNAKKRNKIVLAILSVALLLVVGFFTIHIYDEADCTHPETCKICGKTRGEALGHVWDDGTVIKEADCENDGTILYTCLVDPSHTKEEAIPAKGHDWKPATYYEPETCRRCGETRGEVKGMIHSIDCEWADKEAYFDEAFGKVHATPLEFSEIGSCMSITITLTLDENNLDRDWKIIFRSNGDWAREAIVSEEIINGQTEITRTFTFDPAVDIDAFVAFPLFPANSGEHSWEFTASVKEAQAME